MGLSNLRGIVGCFAKYSSIWNFEVGRFQRWEIEVEAVEESLSGRLEWVAITDEVIIEKVAG